MSNGQAITAVTTLTSLDSTTPNYALPADTLTQEALTQDTPRPQAVRFTGWLDTISASSPTVLLTADSGESVLARFGVGIDPEQLRAIWNHRVLITGMAHYRPSGAIQQIVVDGLHRADPKDELFSCLPLPASRQPLFHPKPHQQLSELASLIGTWPGHESDAELLEALRAIR